MNMAAINPVRGRKGGLKRAAINPVWGGGACLQSCVRVEVHACPPPHSHMHAPPLTHAPVTRSVWRS